jgi:16S rRNA (guanine966-N2)-methyltransferase
MRIIGGKFKGRILSAPSTQAIRPTSDRLRETLFNILTHGFDDCLTGARVLDLFAGTGALGIEALSRGASFCIFIDQSAEARGLIRNNIEALGLTGMTKLFKRDAANLGPIGTLEPFDLVFCDPPYGKGLAEAALNSASAGGWLKRDALIVIEEGKLEKLNLGAAFKVVDCREAGDSQLLFAKLLEG